MSAVVSTLSTRMVTAPLRQPWGPQVTSLSFVPVTVTDSDGAAGHGFAWTPSIGAAAVQALLDTDIREFVVGRPAEPDDLWGDLWAHLHEAGGGGITTIACAGVDLALWDLRARRAGRSLVGLLGRRRTEVRAYGSGVNLHYSLAELTAQAQRWVAAGFDAVKVKVGSPRLDDDVTRVQAVREVIGAERGLMVDANQRWDVETAVRAIDALAEFDLTWVEEPLRADDLSGYRQLRSRTEVPLALGENLYTRYRFEEFIEAGVAAFVQPNVVRVGGITPFLDIDARATRAGVSVVPHLLPEVSTQVALALQHETSVESVEGASFAELDVLAATSPVSIEDGVARETPHVGLGIEFRP